MRRRVSGLHSFIVTTGDDLTMPINQDGANWNATFGPGLLSLFDGGIKPGPPLLRIQRHEPDSAEACWSSAEVRLSCSSLNRQRFDATTCHGWKT